MMPTSWKIVFGILSIVIVYFFCLSMYHLYSYAKWNQSTHVKTIALSVKEISDERYLLQAHYTFVVRGVTYSGETVLHTRHYLNPWAAEQAIPDVQKQIWTVWFSPSNPYESSLERLFPTKESVSTLLLVGLLIYFACLRYYTTHTR